MSLLDDLIARRDEGLAYLETVASTVEARDTKIPTDEERAGADYVRSLLGDYNERIADMALVERSRTIAAHHAPAVVRSEPLTYTHDKSVAENISYFRDLWMMKQHGSQEATARLQRHAQELDVEMPNRAARRAANAERETRNAIGWDAPSPFEKRTNPNRTDGTGGYLVPPLWMMDELIPILRAGRVVADQVRKFDLPEGTDSINIPKLSTGTTTAVQTADAASVSSTDFTDTSVSAGVKTIAGQQDVSIQLVEQSPLSLDEILFADLIADYNKKLDLQVLAGANANGEVEGLYSSAGASPWSNVNTVTYTDASPTVAEYWPVFAQSMSKISQNRFSVQNVKFFLHPRRWFWLVGGVDGQNRPLVLPRSFQSFNAMGEAAGMVAEGYVGDMALGAPVFIDANITTSDTAGSGSGQDISIALKSDDAFLFEGTMRQRTLPEILSGTLQVRYQVYNYVAFLLRYGQSLAIGSGTGFSAPSGY